VSDHVGAMHPGHATVVGDVRPGIRSGVEISFDIAVQLSLMIIFSPGDAGAVSATESTPSIVYRGGSNTTKNLTPRPILDPNGLSTYDSLEAAVAPGEKAQLIDTRKLTTLKAIADSPPGHVSITPGSTAAVEVWAATRGTVTVHEWTQEVIDAIVGQVRRPK